MFPFLLSLLRAQSFLLPPRWFLEREVCSSDHFFKCFLARFKNSSIVSFASVVLPIFLMRCSMEATFLHYLICSKMNLICHNIFIMMNKILNFFAHLMLPHYHPLHCIYGATKIGSAPVITRTSPKNKLFILKSG